MDGDWISLILQCFGGTLILCDLALAGARGTVSHMVSGAVAAELHTAPNLFSFKFHWLVCWINPGPTGNPLTGSHSSIKTPGKNTVGRDPPERCLVICDLAWWQRVCWQRWWKTCHAACRELLSRQSQQLLLAPCAWDFLTETRSLSGITHLSFVLHPRVQQCGRGWGFGFFFFFIASYGLADTSENLPALLWGWWRVRSAILFCLHGSILHSQNNSAQLTASFACWRVLRHCLVPRAKPVTATSASRQPSALNTGFDLVISLDVAIVCNHLQRSDRQSIWAKW